MAFADMIPPTNLTQQEYSNMVLEDKVEDSVLAEIREDPIPYERWPTTYRTKYRWTPTCPTRRRSTPLTVEMNFYNGEQEVRFYDRLETSF